MADPTSLEEAVPSASPACNHTHSVNTPNKIILPSPTPQMTFLLKQKSLSLQQGTEDLNL